MHTMKIKPLSVNSAYTGKRYATPELKAFRNAVLWSMPKGVKVPSGPLEIIFEFGVSNAAQDWDGCIKAAQDCICKSLKIDDKVIWKGTVEKVLVPKGQEYIRFEILPYEKQKGAE